MAFPTIIDTIISKGSVNVTRKGFGVPLLMHYTTKFANRVIEISSLQELVDTYGFDLYDYKDYVLCDKVGRIFAQNPSPQKIKIGRRATAPAQSMTFTVASSPAPAQGDIYKLSIGGVVAGTYEISITAGAAPTVTSVAAQLVAAINAAVSGGAIATNALGVVTIVPALAGELHMFSDWSSNLTFRDNTPDAGIAADLAACLAEDSDFFGIDLVSDGEAEVKAAAAWCETNKRMLFPTTADFEVLSTLVTTDVGNELKLLNLAYTGCYHDLNCTHSSLGIALFAKVAAQFQPGQSTFAQKELALFKTSKYTSGQLTALQNKNVNHYSEYEGLPVSWRGVTASGEWIDVTRDIEWLNAEIRATQTEALFSASQGSGKVPFTDAGIAIQESALRAVLNLATSVGVLAADPSYTVSVPKASDFTPAQRNTRILTNLTWTGRLAGAIHEVTLRGTVST